MISKISFHPANLAIKPVFSILIPSWNNLAYLQCCIDSIHKNSRYQHDIVIHVNEGRDGTLEWVKSANVSYTYSEKNVGVCYGFNAPSTLAQADYIVLSDDDFYFAPDWDFYLLEEIKKLDHHYFCITGTMIEHTVSTNRAALAPHNFGMTVKEFDEKRFLKEYASIPFHDWTGGNWYPLVLDKRIWQLIGGLSVEFSPGIGSDPDMMMKLWQCGVRYYKGLSASRVYHFGSKSTARVRKNHGYNQFMLKWGVANSTLFKRILKIGDKFSGYTPDAEIKVPLKNKVKRVIASFKKNTVDFTK